MNTIRLWLPNYLLTLFLFLLLFLREPGGCALRSRGAAVSQPPPAGSGVRRPGTPGTRPGEEPCRLVLHEDRSATAGPPSCCLCPIGSGSAGQGCSRVEVEPGAQTRPPNSELPKDPEFEQGNDPPLPGRGERPVCCELNDPSLNFLRKLDQEPLVH